MSHDKDDAFKINQDEVWQVCTVSESGTAYHGTVRVKPGETVVVRPHAGYGSEENKIRRHRVFEDPVIKFEVGPDSETITILRSGMYAFEKGEVKFCEKGATFPLCDITALD